MSGATAVTIETSNPALHAIGRTASDRGCELWLTNLSAQPISVEIDGAMDLRLATLDETSFELASTLPDFLERTAPGNTPGLELQPFAISHVTFFRRS